MTKFTLKRISDAMTTLYGSSPSKTHTRNREIVRAGLVDPLEDNVSQGKTAHFDLEGAAALNLFAYYSELSRSPAELKKLAEVFVPKPMEGRTTCKPNTEFLSEVVSGSLAGARWVLELFIIETKSADGPRQKTYIGGYRLEDEETRFAPDLIGATADRSNEVLREHRIIYVSDKLTEFLHELSKSKS